MFAGVDPGFQVRGGGGGSHLKKLRRAEGGANIFGVFRVKNRYFTTKNRIFSNFRPPPPPLDPPLVCSNKSWVQTIVSETRENIIVLHIEVTFSVGQILAHDHNFLPSDLNHVFDHLM